MTASGVPSPQEDEAFIDSLYNAVENTVKEPGWRMVYTERIVRSLLPLFAARVEAIEQERDLHLAAYQAQFRRSEAAEDRALTLKAELAALQERVAELTANLEAAGDELQAAWRATGEVAERMAAERKQAAAQALAEHEAYEDEKAQQRIEGGR